MTTEQTRDVVKTYFRAWTTKDFEGATRQLAEQLSVEVPINTYPDRAAFAQALAGFGAMTQKVSLLGEFVDGADAMLLYDMDVASLGTLRIAEHFHVENGRITQLRQVHDTHALRLAGFVKS
ncbi:MAG: hypothetical protein DI536_13290 [Archangium gephyra]|uniref:SnoaL-like domain-containing protein n=1 Tax=Archangium gephyra TaxID=48 RepID=A0A2W5TPK1_9BACT|nr:MAG: hypothetical protein DI536_13290 [Archangium gephyra]